MSVHTSYSTHRNQAKPSFAPATNVQINRSITQAKSTNDIFSIWERSHDNFNAVNFATIFNRLSKQKRISQVEKNKAQDIVNELLKAGDKKLGDFTPQHLTN